MNKLAKVCHALLPAIEQAGDMFEEYLSTKKKEYKYDQMLLEIERLEAENENLKSIVSELQEQIL